MKTEENFLEEKTRNCAGRRIERWKRRKQNGREEAKKQTQERGR